MTLTPDEYYELEGLYLDVRQEWEKVRHTPDADYWQGKKDGLRTLLALIAPTEHDRQGWELLQGSSTGGPENRSTLREKLVAQVKDAYRMLEMLQTDTYPEMQSDAQRWVEWVDRTQTIAAVTA